MKVLNEYEGSHHYFDTYENEVNMYCPSCGTKGSLWTSDSGDYYMGCTTYCAACGLQGYLHGGMRKSVTKNDIKIVDQLKRQQTDTPTTRRGN